MTGHNSINANDLYLGHEGADTVVVGLNHGAEDTSGDFTDGEDVIDLTAFTSITGFSDLTVVEDDGHISSLLIDLGDHGGGVVRLDTFGDADIDIDRLDADDFVFYAPPPDAPAYSPSPI